MTEIEQLELEQLNAALANAQGEFPAIAREKTVTVKTKTGGSYSFAYAPLDAILNACRPVLAKNGLAITQLLEQENGKPALRTELRHKNGGVIGSSFPLLRLPDSPQELGSLLTYLRRYAIVALLGIATEEDDDGGQTTEDQERTSTFQAPDPAVSPALTGAQSKKIHALLAKLKKTGVPGFDDDSVRTALDINYRVKTISELSQRQASNLIDKLEARETELGSE